MLRVLIFIYTTVRYHIAYEIMCLEFLNAKPVSSCLYRAAVSLSLSNLILYIFNEQIYILNFFRHLSLSLLFLHKLPCVS